MRLSANKFVRQLLGGTWLKISIKDGSIWVRPTYPEYVRDMCKDRILILEHYKYTLPITPKILNFAHIEGL